MKFLNFSHVKGLFAAMLGMSVIGQKHTVMPSLAPLTQHTAKR